MADAVTTTARVQGGRLVLTIGTETGEASVEFWRRVLFDAAVRDRVQQALTSAQGEPVLCPAWWNGGG